MLLHSNAYFQDKLLFKVLVSLVFYLHFFSFNGCYKRIIHRVIDNVRYFVMFFLVKLVRNVGGKEVMAWNEEFS